MSRLPKQVKNRFGWGQSDHFGIVDLKHRHITTDRKPVASHIQLPRDMRPSASIWRQLM